MGKLLVLLCALVFVIPVVLSGCTSVTGGATVVCNEPYIRVGTDCCLDANDNSICDGDEKEDSEAIVNNSLVVNGGTVCSAPYIRVGVDCCLDENSNKICDEDEKKTASAHSDLSYVAVLVTRVIDGDTIELASGERVRLLGINTPEKGQPYFLEATEWLRERIEGKEVRLEDDVTDKDKYDRLLRYIYYDDVFINLELVRRGYATVFMLENVKYKSEFIVAEDEAKSLGLGIWRRPSGSNLCDDNCIGIAYFSYNAEGNDNENLNGEYVTFRNSCAYACELTGWTVKDEATHIYTFPNFELAPSASATLYTGSGIDSEVDLYWEESRAVWNNAGDTLYLRDVGGYLVLDYSYAGYD